MKFKIKKLNNNAVIPEKAHISDAGFDLYSVEDISVAPGQTVLVDTGIAIQPENPDPFKTVVSIIKERSGLASRGIRVGAGVIDSGYSGPLKVCITNLNVGPLFDCMITSDRVTTLKDCISEGTHHIKKGDKIAQILPHELLNVEWEEVDELESTDRNQKGFGSSG